MKIRHLSNKLFSTILYFKLAFIYNKFKNYTMIPKNIYIKNLELINKFKNVKGSVVECGTWRGGMIGGVGKLYFDDRKYFLFDSFEGLPEAREIDGKSAIEWQNDKNSPYYFNNCKAEEHYAESAMKLAGVKNYYITKGWFSDTLTPFSKKKEQIAILRLDGDWYDSTMCCLENLYDLVVEGGVIILDDYYAWDGCAKAVHDFLSKNKSSSRINKWGDTVCYIIKKSN
jgi:O-methyltransferase